MGDLNAGKIKFEESDSRGMIQETWNKLPLKPRPSKATDIPQIATSFPLSGSKSEKKNPANRIGGYSPVEQRD